MQLMLLGQDSCHPSLKLKQVAKPAVTGQVMQNGMCFLFACLTTEMQASEQAQQL